MKGARIAAGTWGGSISWEVDPKQGDLTAYGLQAVSLNGPGGSRGVVAAVTFNATTRIVTYTFGRGDLDTPGEYTLVADLVHGTAPALDRLVRTTTQFSVYPASRR